MSKKDSGGNNSSAQELEAQNEYFVILSNFNRARSTHEQDGNLIIRPHAPLMLQNDVMALVSREQDIEVVANVSDNSSDDF